LSSQATIDDLLADLRMQRLQSTVSIVSVLATPEPNTPATPSSNCAFLPVLCSGEHQKFCASSASVFSPFKAASATFALNAGVWFRRVRFVISAS
jgi:hypothetical protein